MYGKRYLGSLQEGEDACMRGREKFLDKYRVAATCAVVLLHTITGVTDMTDMSLYPGEKKVFLVALDLICWCVPVFLMISGYLFLNPNRKIGRGQMLTKYCRRILLALFLFGIPYAWLEQIALEGTFRPGMLWEGVLMVLRGESWSHLWYLYLILFLYLLTPAMKWLLARMPGGTIYGLLAFLFAGSSLLPYLSRLLEWERKIWLPEWGIYFFYYIWGYVFVTAGRPERKMKTKKFLFYLPGVLLGAGMACSRLTGNYVLQMAYNYPFTVLLSLLLFGAGVFSRDLPGDSGEEAAPAKEGGFPWGRAGEISFAVYLIHPVFLNLFYKFFHITPLDYPLGIALPVFFGGTLLLAAAASLLLRRLPPFKKYVL